MCVRTFARLCLRIFMCEHKCVCAHPCVHVRACVRVCAVYIHTCGDQRTILGFILQVLPIFFETVFLTGLELHQVN